MRANSSRIASLLLLTSALALPGLAFAQTADPNPNVAVQNRPRPDYDPIGLRAGSFFFYPELTLSGLYDDNVFAADDDEESDFAALLSPRLRAQSNFSRHSLTLDVGAELARYQDNDELDYEDFYALTGGRLDITREDILSADLGVKRLHEDPSDPDSSEGDDEVTKFWQDTASLSYRKNFARFFTVLGGDFARYDFEDTDDTNEDDRDRNQYAGRLRFGYEISPRLAAFLQGLYDIRRYDETPDDQGRDRDSEGYSLRAGTEIDITSILFGEVGFGYTSRTYDDDDLDSVNGFGFGGKLTWNVTPLTTIGLDAEGEIQETTVGDGNDEASANFQKKVILDINHELLRNVLLNGNVGYIRDDFEGIDRTDNTLRAGAGVSYLLNRHLSLDATYDFSTRDSDENDEEYTRNRFLVGITGKL
jgi:hypothetical protein